MRERLLVVTSAYEARGGSDVMPKIASDGLPPSPFAVTLRTPDGAERSAKATAIVAHVRGPLPPFALVRVLDVPPQALPAGTEVWVAGVTTCEGRAPRG